MNSSSNLNANANAIKSTVILTGVLYKNAHLKPEFNDCAVRASLNAEKYGGKVVQKYQIKENLGSGGKMDFILIVEYPSQEQMLAAHANAEYQSIQLLRAEVFREFNVYLTH
ncbi:hypothetical protein TDB9533_03775 [Thalassocella blandensis]|nr:hypothetical protein TDB9533_03775 [Thalassocella blandensis]